MKYLICLALVFLAVEARSRHRRDADPLKSMLEKFPHKEFQAFWAKFQEASESNMQTFKAKLEENDGNLDQTLTDVKDKIGAKYPQIREKFDEAQTKMKALIKKMDEVTLRDIFLKVREFFVGQYEGLDREEAKRRMTHVRATVYNFFNQLAAYQP